MKPLILIPHRSYSPAAISHARLIAKKTGTSLHILYVGAHERHQKSAIEIFEQAKEQLSGIDVTTEVVIGDPLCRVVAP